MADTDRRDVRRAFMEVADLPRHEWEAALERACAGNAALRAEVEALLAADLEADAFMANPTEASGSVGALRGVGEGPGSCIGPYRLVELIGEGGFGSVFMAEQERPVARRVALKIIKLGMDTRQVIARFEAERQALVILEHPNVARVLDAGATETGRPYFVMELVKGERIDEYCDRNTLSVRARLELFAQVCNAGGDFSNETWVMRVRTIQGGPTISVQPVGRRAQPGGGVSLAVVAQGEGTLHYQWRRNASPLSEGGSVGGSATPTLVIDPIEISDTGVYDVVASNACDDAISIGVLVDVARCAADFNADERANSQDFFDFLTLFFMGSPGADFDGSGTVDSADLFSFLEAFFAGCD